MNKRTSARSIHIAILLVLVTLLLAGPALAAPSLQGPTDPAELEAFLDEFTADQCTIFIGVAIWRFNRQEF